VSAHGHDRRSRGLLAAGSQIAVANYAARNSWLDLCDLQQEAALAALEASRTWRPDGGSTREQREAWVVALALSRFVAEQRCPVSLPKRKGESWRAAASTRRVDVEADQDGESRPGQDHPDVARVAAERFQPLEDILDTERASAELRRILDEESVAARLVLLDEERSAVVAERLGVPVRDVYAQTKRAMLALRAQLCPA
jgi:DNA-directed RNA polymerase specialized sigma24 family protein